MTARRIRDGQDGMTGAKVTPLARIKENVIAYKPWRKHEPIFRHQVTILVDTPERSAGAVMVTVQACLDEHIGTIQPDEVVEFDEAKAIGCTRIEER